MGLEKNENVLAGGRKRTRGIVRDNEKKIAAKSGRRRWRGGRGGGPVHAPLRSTVRTSARLSVRPGRRPVQALGTGGWTDRRLRAFQIRSRLVFPGAVINYDRNRRARVHALSVTLVAFKLLYRMAADGTHSRASLFAGQTLRRELIAID